MKKFAVLIGTVLAILIVKICVCIVMTWIACRCFGIDWKPDYGVGVSALLFAADTVFNTRIETGV